MATGTQDHVGIELTPQEAEAVLELWAKRQAEGELRSRLNVQDLAEAMSLPPSEVEKMVAAIRLRPIEPHLPITIPKPKPVNSFLIAVAAIVWVAILIGVGFLAFDKGRETERNQRFGFPMSVGINPPAEVVDIGSLIAPPAPLPAEIATADSDLTERIPSGVTVEFKGYKVRGESNSDVNENRIHETLKKIVDDVVPAGQVDADIVQSDVAIIDALQTNDATKINGHIRFERLILNAHGQAMNLAIPVAVVNEPRLNQLVQDEQMSRLKILANWAFNTQNAPASPPPAR